MMGRVVYILRIWGSGRVECDAQVATRWQWCGAALARVHIICVIARSHARARAARQCLQSLAANPSVHDISAELLVRTEPELVISGPAACGSPAVANEIGVNAISCPAEPDGSAAAARHAAVVFSVAPSEQWRQWSAIWQHSRLPCATIGGAGARSQRCLYCPRDMKLTLTCNRTHVDATKAAPFTRSHSHPRHTHHRSAD